MYRMFRKPGISLTAALAVAAKAAALSSSNPLSITRMGISSPTSPTSSNSVLFSATSSAQDSIMASLKTSAKNILFDVPVSNNGGRCRIILYQKEIPESECTIVSPMELGGFRSEGYLSVNPQGKVPSLRCQTTGASYAESDTVCRYLMSEYADTGPSFQPDNPLSNQIARFHDLYLTTIQSCLYRAAPPFGSFGTRKDALAEYSKQLYVIADLMMAKGDDGYSPYLCGGEVSLADATVFPSIVFASYMFPKFEGAVSAERPPIPGAIQAWYQRMIDTEPAFQKVYDEIHGALENWNASGRWDSIWLAGVRDTDPETIFDKIVRKEIPATIVREDDTLLAFEDINPAAPAHVLVIPKDRSGLSRLSKATPDHTELLGRLMVAAGEIAADESLGFGDGARIVINDGKKAGQEVFHLHVHVLGGRDFSWPPG